MFPQGSESSSSMQGSESGSDDGSGDGSSNEDENEKILPDLKEGDKVQIKEIIANEHHTQPPGRYTEASLIKSLEKEGIGRPSTYAVIIEIWTLPTPLPCSHSLWMTPICVGLYLK